MAEYKDMLGRSGVKSVEDARRVFFDSLIMPGLHAETSALTEALGRVLADDIVSKTALPDFARSSMDGYAVIAKDTYGATDSMPSYLKVAGEVLMGEMPAVPAVKGCAIRISTGGMLPPGADAVVMLEDTERISEGEIEVHRPVSPGENVVQRGDDVREGEKILGRGHKLRPQDLGALAGIGITQIPLFSRPVVAIINTGNEVVGADEKPSPGQVRDVNSYNLAGLVIQAGGVPVRKGIFRDEYGTIRGAVEGAVSSCDIVAITGGSSVGTGDLTARVIDDLGPPGVVVHGVSVRPGKPVIIGIAAGKPVFGLPGHPVAVTVSFELFLLPLIKRLSGEIDRLGIAGIPQSRVIMARMSRNYSSAQGREDHLRVALERREDGELWAVPVLGKSGLISTLVKADGTVVVPLSRSGLEKGETVEVRLFE